jgi:hypothetical protein
MKGRAYLDSFPDIAIFEEFVDQDRESESKNKIMMAEATLEPSDDKEGCVIHDFTLIADIEGEYKDLFVETMGRYGWEAQEGLLLRGSPRCGKSHAMHDLVKKMKNGEKIEIPKPSVNSILFTQKKESYDPELHEELWRRLEEDSEEEDFE